LIEAIDLAVSYAAGRLRRPNAVDGVSLKICAGRTIGLVGESGCGKSTLARALMRLVPLRSGTLRFAGRDISRSGERALKPFRRRIQMVFQDPFGSLNPRHSVGFILESALTAHGEGDRASRRRRAAELLERVGLDASAAQRYPNEFSGGQRQRIGIARALMAQPDLLILDEPVSALDVSVQAQILNLLVELKSELGLAYLFISHDLTVVRYMADEVIVMREGRFLENAPQREFWASPKSAYARELLAVAPRNVYSEAVIPPST
jgi:peptide/nickel transport system ATP-binding protein